LISIFNKLALEDIFLNEISIIETPTSGEDKTAKALFDVSYKLKTIKGISCTFPSIPSEENQA